MTYNFVNTPGPSPKTASKKGFLTNLGAFDIAASQYLYGPNLTTNLENNTYKLNGDLNGITCIWDNGGIDNIDASESKKRVDIDLRNATLLNKPPPSPIKGLININGFILYILYYVTKLYPPSRCLFVPKTITHL